MQLSNSFFVIIDQSVIDHKRLIIPAQLIQNLEDELSDIVKLSLPNGDEWRVHFKKAKKMALFLGGWEDFTKDNSIGVEYFLLFKYTKSSSFTVHIFDLTATEIAYPSNARGARKRRVPIEDRVDESSDRKRKGIAKGKLLLHNPYFTLPLVKYQALRQDLYVTREFARMILPGKPKTVIVEDRDGKRWTVNCNFRSGRVSHLGKGWRGFADEKKLVEGNVCVFELIKDSQANMPILKVHIFPSQEDLPQIASH